MMHNSLRLITSHLAQWLSFAATPTFALMGALAVIPQSAHQMSCSAATDVSPLGGMLVMYALMSAFHVAPWLKLISRWGTPRTRLGSVSPVAAAAPHTSRQCEA